LPLLQLTPEEPEDVLQSLPPEKRLAGLSDEQIRKYLERRTAPLNRASDGRSNGKPRDPASL
jgi:hypothetical protein